MMIIIILVLLSIIIVYNYYRCYDGFSLFWQPAIALNYACIYLFFH